MNPYIIGGILFCACATKLHLFANSGDQMGFHGNLKTMHLGDVFQNILQNRSAGNLRLQTKEMGDVSLFFMEGELTLYHSKNLEEIQWSRVFLAKGELTEEEVAVVESQGIKGEEELAGIVSSQIISEEKAAISLQHIIEEEIYELFSINDCDFSFESATEIPTFFTYTELFKRTIFNTNMILMEAARRSDEHSQEGNISSHEIFGQVQDKEKAIRANLDEDEWRIYDLIDGFRNVLDIVRDSGSKRQNIVKILKKFLELQIIKISETKDLLAKASHLASIQDYDSAAKIYRRLIDTEKAVLGHRELLADTFLKLQQKENAIMQLEIMANEYITRKDFKKANDGFQKILEIDDTKLNIRELIANNYIEMGKKKDAVAELKHVLQLYLDSGVFEKAKDICSKLLVIEPEDIKVMELLAKTCVNRGDRAQAVEILNKISEIYIGRQLLEDASEVLKRILKIEPSNDRAKEMLNTLGLKMGKAKTRQTLVLVLGSIIIVIILIVSMLIYLDQSVKRSLEDLTLTNEKIALEIMKSVKLKEVEEKTDLIIKSYEKFKSDHPLSLTAFEIHNLIEEVHSIKRKKLEEFRRINEEKSNSLEEEFSLVMEGSEHKKTLQSISELEDYIEKIKSDPKFAERLNQVKARVDFLKQLESNAHEKFKQIEDCVQKNKLAEANALGKEVISVFSKTSFPDKIVFYVSISSSETDSKLTINGEAVARVLPLVQSYKPNQTIKVLIQKDGYYDFTEEISDGNKAVVNAVLNRKILWKFDMQNPIFASPVFKDGVLYVSSRNGRTVALAIDFSADTYKEVWSHKMNFPSSDILASGYFENDIMYVGSSDRHLYSIDLSAGREYWKKKMAGHINSSVSISKVSLKQEQKMIFVASADTVDEGLVYGLDAKTGEIEWQRKIRGRSFSDVLATSAKVYIGTDQNKIVVLRASTGLPIETVNKDNEPIPLEYKSFGQFKSSLVLKTINEQEYIFASSMDQNLYCFEEKTGNKVWNYPTNAPNGSGVNLDDQNVYNCSMEGLITSINIEESIKNKKPQLNWSIRLEGLKDPTQVFVTDTILYLGGTIANKKGKLFALRKNDGKLLWTLETPAPINCRPLVVESRVFVGCDDNMVYVLKELK